jgi:hypothetical protein
VLGLFELLEKFSDSEPVQAEVIRNYYRGVDLHDGRLEKGLRNAIPRQHGLMEELLMRELILVALGTTLEGF